MPTQFFACLTWAIGMPAVFTVIGTHLLTLDRYPGPWVDEAWYSDPGASLLKVGRFAGTLFSGMAGFEISNVAYGRIYLLGQALSFAALGIGVFEARLPSLICGGIAAFLIYVLGTRLFNRFVGVIAASLFVTSDNFVLSSHSARPE